MNITTNKVIGDMNNICGNISINGVEYSGNNIVINGDGDVIIDGNTAVTNGVKLEIKIVGSVGEVALTNGRLDVEGDVMGNISSTNGDVFCGDVNCNVTTTNGDVNTGKVNGNVSSKNGDIRYNR